MMLNYLLCFGLGTGWEVRPPCGIQVVTMLVLLLRWLLKRSSWERGEWAVMIDHTILVHTDKCFLNSIGKFLNRDMLFVKLGDTFIYWSSVQICEPYRVHSEAGSVPVQWRPKLFQLVVDSVSLPKQQGLCYVMAFILFFYVHYYCPLHLLILPLPDLLNEGFPPQIDQKLISCLW